MTPRKNVMTHDEGEDTNEDGFETDDSPETGSTLKKARNININNYLYKPDQ